MAQATTEFVWRPDEETLDRANVAIGTSINFYAAAFQMWRHGVMDDGLWDLLAGELVGMLALDRPKRRWSAIKAGSDPRFVEDIDGRLDAIAEKAATAERAATARTAVGAKKAETQESS